jgi:hypothetical protein
MSTQLNREFSEHDIQRMRNIISGNTGNATKIQTLWYYRQLANIFTNRKCPPAKALEAAVSQMEALSDSAW